MTPEDRLRAVIRRQGPVPWSTVIEIALYGPGGFYASGGGAGRDRDFLTSPEVGPLFGAVVARAVDEAWLAAGHPDPWLVVEGGAGAGALASAVLGAGPACAAALRYVAVETSPALRADFVRRVAVEDPAEVLGPSVADDPEVGSQSVTGIGPMACVLEDLPAAPFDGLVIANELLDNLPFDIYRSGPGGWVEVRVGQDGDALGEIDVPAASDLTVGSGEIPIQRAAGRWVERALGLVRRGRVIVIDYARTSAELAVAGRAGWLRTYRAGGRGAGALEQLGAQDITADVALDQLPAGATVGSQADWLRRHGLEELVEQARAAWRDGAAAPGLAELAARSRVAEAQALIDPAGLGGFTVCEWAVAGR